MPRFPILLATALSALALAPAAPAQLPAGGFASDDVEFVRNIATGPSSGGRLLDGYFYLTTGRDLRIFDVTDPENPVETGSVLFPSPGAGEQRAPEEDPETNGKILLTTNGGALQVFDVSDKKDPKVLAELAGVSQHTISCVLDCTWAYGSEGVIIDLRDPANPKEAGDWMEAADSGAAHDVTEVSPGLVLTSTNPILLLDARQDPLRPARLAEAAAPGFVHATLWPHGGTDDLMLAGGEATGPECSANPSATFMTWDTRGWAGSRTFKRLDEFAMQLGAPPDGRSPATTFCTHWFDTHPAFRGGGLVAIGWYEHGTRFLSVGLDGKITEVGWFLPTGTRSSAVYWVSEKVAYIADYYRGLDVVKWNGAIPPSQPAPGPGPGPGQGGPGSEPPRGGPSFDRFVRLPSSRRCASAKRFRIRVRRYRPDPATRVTVAVEGRKVLTARGRKLRRPLRLKSLPRRRSFDLQVLVRTRSGHETAGQRRYRGCAR